MDLSKFDLNLLKCLMVLLQEKNTSKAAERLGVSQPAVSRSLAKIRTHFDDPLFVKQARGLGLTDRAVELAEQLPDVLAKLESCLAGQEFEPSQLTGKLRLAINNYLSESHGFAICQALLSAAPNIELELHNYSPSTQIQLVRQTIDAAISFYPLEVSKEIRQTKITSTPVGAFCQLNHPIQGQVFTADDLLCYPIAGLILSEFNEQGMQIEKLLKPGQHLKPKFRSQQLSTILDYTASSDALCIAPRSSYTTQMQTRFRFVELSHQDKGIDMPVVLLYHNSQHRTKKYQWLTQVISSLFQDV
ncbi:LysR family transcriptional regulator [Corallincola spongiicola]|uniref:LysR family transcriptional regulator n=1 Tax=Corallincola spongiicola TaxID=2520508 RepID=A0ABY1WQF0_9GAMM|nr:LysR family transcriptional regulator [Corallincola spongiicola]TAA46951.1 LysR family transcriptional regulator [Corallincola spongiicola]